MDQEAIGEKDIVIRHYDGSINIDTIEAQGDTTTVLLVAMESKGKNPRHAKIVELAGVLIEVESDSGKVVRLLNQQHWFQDPEEEEPFSEGFTHKTGITEELVSGKSIDGREFEDMVQGADIVVAYNAGFVRPILSEQFPSVEDAIFACARNQIDWSQKGHESRSLHHLTRDHLWFCDERRCPEQCGILLKLLTTDKTPEGEDANYLKELMDRAQEPLITIEAKVEHHQKHLMRKERFFWDSRERTHIRVMGTSTLERVKRNLESRGFSGELIERDRLPATERFK
jgi:DNA polymerase III subunit epsilon